MMHKHPYLPVGSSLFCMGQVGGRCPPRPLGFSAGMPSPKHYRRNLPRKSRAVGYRPASVSAPGSALGIPTAYHTVIRWRKSRDENELFRVAWRLAAPWQMVRIEFSLEAQPLDSGLDFPRGSPFPCPESGQLCGAYDTQERTWRYLNFFQHQTHWHARPPRVPCPEHGVKTVEVPGLAEATPSVFSAAAAPP